MNNFTKIALVTLFVTNFTLFLGWVHIGVLIPQILFFILALLMHPNAFVSKGLVLYYLFFAYQMISGIIGGNVYDITLWGARFLGMAVPLAISTVIFTPKLNHDCRYVSIYALCVSFITVLLSIRVLINDGVALRVTSMANSVGDWNVLYNFWQQGMADYAMAAMMLFMPVVLIYYLKYSIQRIFFMFALIGIFVIFAFMYLSQVTTAMLLCLGVTILSFFNLKSQSFSFVAIGMIVVMIVSQFSGLMDIAISLTGETDMNERFIAVADVARGGSLDVNSDAGIRWTLLDTSITSFLSHPLFGSPKALYGGHNYFLDLLAQYGILGCLPFFLLLYNQYKIVSSYLSPMAKRYYLIIIIGFITLGLLKNLSGTEYWNYLFIYYPAILVWFDSKTIFLK